MTAKIQLRFLAALFLFLTTWLSASAWGPHPTITRAAFERLPKDDPLRRLLGPNLAHLTTYCWLADESRALVSYKTGTFYADDYLLFPGMHRHLNHLCPMVKGTYIPYFHRTVQALRTETPENAVRWTGSLLHFVEDTGSPPHAAEISGQVHAFMENWVDSKLIVLDGYQPALLGKTDVEALAGFLKRMDGLIAFSKERGLRLRPLVIAGKRAEVEPVVLESALETSRVVADLLHTLGQLSTLPGPGTATLKGTITHRPLAGLEKLPVKVVLMKTGFSTLADETGHFEFRNLPEGNYGVQALYPGQEISQDQVELKAGMERVLDITLKAGAIPENRLRNPSFQLQWVRPDAADCWYLGRDGWEGELIPVKPGESLRLQVDWRDLAKGEAAILWKTGANDTLATERPLIAGQAKDGIFTAPEKTRFAQVVLLGKNAPETLCTRVALTPEKR